MLFLVVMRHGKHVRRIELDAPDREGAELVAQRQNLEVAAEHGTPVYTLESCEPLAVPKRSFLGRLLSR